MIVRKGCLMIQTLKRIYLYTATAFAVLFSAGITINLLSTLFALAGLRPLMYTEAGLVESPPPSAEEALQSMILFVVGLVLVGLLFGGMHYWLIRRDARSDQGADGGPTRHLFLNGLLALAALFTVSFALPVLASVGDSTTFRNNAFPLAFALTALAVFVLVLMERRRSAPVKRAAVVIRQVQEQFLEAILLVIGSISLLSTIQTQVSWVLLTNGLEQRLCYDTGPFQFGPPLLIPCPPPLALGPWLQVAFMLVAWGTSVWIGAWDRRSMARWIVRFSALGYGLVWLLVGIELAVSTGAGIVFHGSAAWQAALNDELPFVGVLMTGALIILPYFLWIQRADVASASAKQARHQGVLGLPAALSFAFLLIGGSLALSWAVEQLVPAGHLATRNDWAQAIGFLVAGVAWLPLWLMFKRNSDPTREGPTLPRRGYVLGVLGYTGIASVAAAVFALYQLIEAALGLLTADHLVARQAATVAVLVGAAALYHGLRLRLDLHILHARQPALVIAPLADVPSTSAETLEEILQAAVAGKIGIERAAARIRALYAMEQPEQGMAQELAEHQLVAR
jgi:hypothetical protein